MAKEVRPITKFIPLKESRIIPFCTLLYAKQRGANVTRRQGHGFDPNEQDVAAVRE